MQAKIRHSILVFIAFLFSLFLLLGYRAEAASVKIKLNKSSVTLYTNGTKTVKLKAAVTGSKGKVKWRSSNKKVATVSSSGKVTAKKAGKTTITAKFGGKTSKCKITVKDPAKKLKIAVAYSASGDANAARVALQRAGAVVDIVWNCDVKDYDGLVIPGGTDIDPARYKTKNMGSVGINRSLDSLQFALMKKFVKAEKPVFGICRGLQLINVYFGGTLKQNIPHHRGLYHATTIVKKSRLEKLYGHSLRVISYHHQAADKIGAGLKVTQRASDKNVEGLEHETLPVLGVQWHPEYMGSTGQIVLKDFLKTCKRYRDQ